MEEDSTPEAQNIDTGGSSDDFDLSAEDHSQDSSDDTSADSSDDDSSNTNDDNAPSDSEDDSANDDKKSKTEDSADKAPTFDKDLDKWAEDRGYGPLENDKERRIAQDARNSQRDFSKRAEASAQAKKLADNINQTAKEEIEDDADPLAKDVAQLKADLMTERQNRQVSEFVFSMSEAGTPVTVEESDAMGELLAETLKTDGKAGVDFLIKNIPRWHKLAKLELGIGQPDTDEISTKARQEERERIKKETNAAGPNRSAKSNAPVKGKDELTKIWEDDSI